MLSDDTRKRLENIVSGNVLEGTKDNCTTARNLLCGSFRTSTTVKKDFEGQARVKEEQAEFLRHYSIHHDYLNPELGLILEDMHDENIIVNTKTLFFIDTVFYTVSPG